MSNRLAFIMQSQLQTEWCWAAVAASVSSFFGAPPGPNAGAWQQCDIVNAEQGQADCCQNGSGALCNVDWYLDRALTRVGHLAGPATPGPSQFAYVQGEIDGGRPVAARIGWFGGGGHFVVLRGYDDSDPTNILLDVEDPWYQSSVLAYGTFSNSYQGSGTWTHTYPIS